MRSDRSLHYPLRYTKALDSIKSLRKDRVSELKAEKERLESLAREKAHADKLRGRISDLTATIAAKEIEYEEVKKAHRDLSEANQKFYEISSKFRETYLRVEALTQAKAKAEDDLAQARVNIQEVEGNFNVSVAICSLLTLLF